MTSALAEPAMSLADFTSPTMIVPNLRGRDVTSVLQELSQALQREGCVQDLLPFYHAALNREFLASTDVETGIALPHARIAGLKSLAFAFGRSAEPLVWAKHAASHVRMVFLIAVPATDATQHLLLVSGLARLAKNPVLLEKLKTAGDIFQILDLLREVPLRQIGVPSAAADARSLKNSTNR
jgi:mannitol/fructose-specific phosphotransferase system IIA component (Ntr-type)